MRGDDIFKMSQKVDETLEDYVSRFMFNLQRNTQHQLNEESQNHLFLKGVNDEITPHGRRSYQSKKLERYQDNIPKLEEFILIL